MFENYLATPPDFKAIEEGLKKVWSKELNFIFKKKSLIEKVVVTSFDSQNLYFWSTFKLPKFTELKCSFKKYKLFRATHEAKIPNEIQKGWQVGIDWKLFNLPKKFRNWYRLPTISGGLITPSINLHKRLEKERKSFLPENRI